MRMRTSEMRRKLLLRSAIFLMLVAVAGCGRKSAPETTAAPEQREELLKPDDVVITHRTGEVRRPWEGSAPAAPTLPVFTESTEDLGENAPDYSEPTAYHLGLGLRAVATANGFVISAKNKRQDEVVIAAQDLALITGPDHVKDLVLINPGTADLRRFTPLILKPGEQAAREIPIKYLSNTRGTRLVYNNPRQEIRFFVPVE